MSFVEQSCNRDGHIQNTAGKYLDELEPARAERLVVIGGSAGALAPLRMLLGNLSPTTSTAVVVALHGTGQGLDELLQRGCAVPVRSARAGDPVRAGSIYVAAPGTHVVIRPDRSLATPEAPRREGYRPSVDWLFESAAASYGEDLMAIVLSGMMRDAECGAKAVRRLNGRVLVENPDEAVYPEMPARVMTSGETIAASPARLAELVGEFASNAEASRGLTERVSRAASELAEQRARLAATLQSLKRTLSETPERGTVPRLSGN